LVQAKGCIVTALDAAANKLGLEFEALAQKAMAFDVLHHQYSRLYLALNEFRPVMAGTEVNLDWTCVRIKALALLLDNPPAQFAALAGGALITPVAEVPALIVAIQAEVRAAEEALTQKGDSPPAAVHRAALRLADAHLLAAGRMSATARHLPCSKADEEELKALQMAIERVAEIARRPAVQTPGLAIP
jgi:hypothetical protein